MKDELFSDEQLRAALERSQERTMDSLPQTPPRHEFSEAFQKNMNALFQKEKRTLRMRTAIRQVCAALLALVMGLSLFLTISTDARAAVLLWFKEEFGQHSIFWFTGEHDAELPDCTLTWIPENLECVVDETVITRTLVYVDPDNPNRGFTFDYMFMSDDNGVILSDLDQYVIVTVDIKGNDGELYINQDTDGTHMLIWFDEEHRIVFYITAILEVQDILHIAECAILSE